MMQPRGNIQKAFFGEKRRKAIIAEGQGREEPSELAEDTAQ